MDVRGDRRAPAYSRERLADVARRYYLEDRTKLDIARETGLSRFAVARMLDRARSLGVVTIAVEGVDAGPRVPAMRRARPDAMDPPAEGRPSPAVDEELSGRLAERLGLDEAVVVTLADPGSDVRRAVGAAAARWLEDCVVAGDVVACAGAAGPSPSAAGEAGEAFTAPTGVTVTALPPVAGPDIGGNAVPDPWEVITAVVVGPAVAVATADLRRVPHVVVVDAGTGAADALVDAALSGPATVVVTDAAAALAILDQPGLHSGAHADHHMARDNGAISGHGSRQRCD